MLYSMASVPMNLIHGFTTTTEFTATDCHYIVTTAARCIQSFRQSHPGLDPPHTSITHCLTTDFLYLLANRSFTRFYMHTTTWQLSRRQRETKAPTNCQCKKNVIPLSVIFGL